MGIPGVGTLAVVAVLVASTLSFAAASSSLPASAQIGLRRRTPLTRISLHESGRAGLQPRRNRGLPPSVGPVPRAACRCKLRGARDTGIIRNAL